jgi:hypothetical protein
VAGNSYIKSTAVDYEFLKKTSIFRQILLILEIGILKQAIGFRFQNIQDMQWDMVWKQSLVLEIKYTWSPELAKGLPGLA